ncbi:histone-like nucleoid-structuring protein Lsr2 [Streptomyces sp. NPDC086783]|uniref:Lsr2 family DNA-binding protein n=1 Tax=Streptomyces sp. NPDC086783 TaxID=3365758 RepID=UPI0037FC85DD
MSHPGVPKTTDFPDPDPRIPFPHSTTRPRCQEEPGLFDYDYGQRNSNRKQTTERLTAARNACSGCPLVTDCLKWALANPKITRVGIWAATTHRDRQILRKRLVNRLGPDWIDVVAARDRARRDRAAAQRLNPLSVAQARVVALDQEINGPLPPHLPLTPEQQQHNVTQLANALMGSGRTREELAAIRTWARANGHKVADAGMVRKAILEAYDAAHQAPVRKAG